MVAFAVPGVSAVLAELPALPLHTAGKYVAGAFVTLFALVLIYMAIMAIRLSRIERELGELLACTREGELSERTDTEHAGSPSPGSPTSTSATPSERA